MKTLKFLFILITCFTLSVKAQTNNSNHPTISSVKSKYKAVPSQNTSTLSLQILAIPEATVVLKNTSNVSKIFFKIIDNSNNSVVYDVNYLTNSSVILSNDGKKLFENINGTIFISSGVSLPLKPYTYQVYTQDNQSVSSPVFNVMQ